MRFRPLAKTSLESLKKRADFLRVQGSQNRRSSPFFTLLCHTCADRSDLPSRVGYTATKKLGGAVERNRIKRRLRALTALCAAHFKPFGVDYVFLARLSALDGDFEAMRKALEHALIQLHRAPTGAK